MMQWYFMNSFVFLWVDHGVRRFAPRGPAGATVHAVVLCKSSVASY